MFPIKYIDNNLVWNKDNEVFAYYELIPYNYSFLSPEQKYLVHDSLLDTFSNVWTGLSSLILLTVPLKARKKSSKSKTTIRIITDKYMNKCLLINFPKFRIIITCSPHLFYIPIL